jgi:hypothetical protein
MKKFDLLWIAVLAAIVAFLFYPDTNVIFINLTNHHPYLMGFAKFTILATMGELLALRVMSGDWKKPVGIFYRALIWGFLGIVITLAIKLFSIGVDGMIAKGLIIKTGLVGTAFIKSILINLIFAPSFMAFHRITDTYIDLGKGKIGGILKVKLADAVKNIDWYGFVSFVILRSVPIFWIPAHTVTFSLQPQYQVFVAALLSIALGGILAFAKKRNMPAQPANSK